MIISKNIVFKYVLVGFLLMGAGGSLHAQKNDRDLQKLQLAYKLISTFYVDSTNDEKLVEDAIVGMLTKLDPHSVYISKEEVAKMNEPLDGSFEGIGVQFNIFKDTLMVVTPISGGPSEKVGIQAGDRILTIDGENVAGVGLKNTDVFSKLKGKKGTKVKLQILRNNVKDLISFTVTRDKIPIYSVEATYMATPQIGYVKINQFSGTTHAEFEKALKKLSDQGMQDLILDLRGNPGGYLKAAIDISDELLTEKKLIVYTEGLTSPRKDYIAGGKGLFESGRVVILIDEGSASASEIVSGAVQDWDRGVVIGRRSYGKGLVQRPLNLPDGSMIRLTIAKYYTPSGRSIQKPYNKGLESYQREIYDRYSNGEVLNVDSIHLDTEKKYYTKTKQRLVYGGGGVMPDLFVPADTTGFSPYYRDLVASGALNQFVLNYLDIHRKQLEAEYLTFEQFNKKFEVGESMLNELIAEGKKRKLKSDVEEFKKVSVLLAKAQIKALIARSLYTSSEYFETINPSTRVYNKALQLLLSESEYTNLLN
ncbi:C-terminal processing peptidase-3. Serine peptidase. MEROPS family S41A [Saccharicrinis carchari]|uniref:C-terminal processing peptidase-3. Serine peptidase. MEROPS family S41A n=1 Tax=Saccharicrinis carchari TaxID=1168039 RepID=A0A521E0H3_SACCC|nr:S41 family peptidase [Saccharicrinis carchari]SMO77469.1 C-terminal processing peptidase-3. Serine peptidase. MEROPS family S41A [Saccharicrinis carchari]